MFKGKSTAGKRGCFCNGTSCGAFGAVLAAVFAAVFMLALTLAPGSAFAAESGNDVDYLCFTAEKAGSTVALNAVGEPSCGQAWEVSTDKSSWTDYVVGTTISLAKVGDAVYWRAQGGGNATVGESEEVYYQYSITGKVAASGSLMTLLDRNDTLRSLAGTSYCFYALFQDCTALTSAPSLPATTLAVHCYHRLFYHCPKLSVAPALPATTLADHCYHSMFFMCSSLVSAPDLPAQTMTDYCYSSMFYKCSALASMPLMGSGNAIAFDKSHCCASMFFGCSDLAVYSSGSDCRLRCSSVTGWSATMNMFQDCSADGDYCRDKTETPTGSFACYGAASGSKSISDCTVSGVERSYAYTGSQIRPTVTVKDGDAVLAEGKDYTVSYGGNTLVGEGTVTVAGMGAYSGSQVATFRIVSASEQGSVVVSGENRYETSAKVARAAYPDGAQGVVVATGENFPDALAASGLAGLLDYPIVLVRTDEVPQGTADAITALGAKKAIIVGGVNAVSDAVRAALAEQLGGDDAVERVSGANRYATALAVYEYGCRVSAAGGAGWGTKAVLATGTNYPDALSISGYAFAKTTPVFLTDPESGMDEDTKTALEQGGFSEAIVVGGEGCVSEADFEAAKAACGAAQRLWGTDRYATSKAIANFCISEGFHADKACIATGKQFPDALSGSALAGVSESVVLLASPADMSTFAVLEANRGKIGTLYFLGGDEAVTPAMRAAAATAAGIGEAE